MRALKSLLVCGLLLAFAGCASDGGGKTGIAAVRAVHGDVQLSVAGQPMQRVRVNMELPEGATITAGPDSRVDFEIGRRTSVVRITENSRMSLEKMKDLGSGNSETVLKVENGLVVGRVKKISKDSTYEVQTPRGTAGIRGTDWAVQVTQQANGEYTVTFTCETGQLYVVANVNVNGVVTQVPKTLIPGQSWTPPKTAPTFEDARKVDEPIMIIPGFMITPGFDWLGEVQPTPQPPPAMPFYVPPVVSPATIGGRGGRP